MRRVVGVTAAIVAAVVVFWVLTWPPAPLVTTGAGDPVLLSRTLAGAFHVHTSRSDGAADKATIAAAAARAGLEFVVFADHGDGTREPDPPAYLAGVLCIDAVEISTNGGHYLALGMARAPYRLGGEPAAVVEDVRRLGGFGVVAHPDSPRRELAWRDWALDVDGVEWLNADTEWRNKSAVTLARTLLDYLVRPAPALARLAETPELTLARWDKTTALRRMAAFTGHDAHGGFGAGREARRGLSIPGIPSYEASFRSFGLRAVLAEPPRGEPAGDAGLLLEALRAGRTFTAMDGAAAPAWLDFSADRDGFAASMGQSIAGSGPVRLRARAPVVPGSLIRLLHHGEAIAERRAEEVSATVTAPGSYRVEVKVPGSDKRAPWILGNPIYVDLPPPVTAPPVVADEVFVVPAAGWRVEKDPVSQAELAEMDQAVGVTFRLRAGPEVSQFAAVAADLPNPPARFDALVLDATAGVPTRVSLQLRSEDGTARWGFSVYLSDHRAATTVTVADFIPLSPAAQQADPRTARSVLLVVDLVNSVPGASGHLVIHRLGLGNVR